MKKNEKLPSLRCIKISKCCNFFSNQDKRNPVCINTENKLIIIMQFKPSEYLNSVRSSRGNQNCCFFPIWPPLPVATDENFFFFFKNQIFLTKPIEKSTQNIIYHLNSEGPSLRVLHPLKTVPFNTTCQFHLADLVCPFKLKTIIPNFKQILFVFRHRDCF